MPWVMSSIVSNNYMVCAIFLSSTYHQSYIDDHILYIAPHCTLVQVRATRQQDITWTNADPYQCWPISLLPFGVTRPQKVECIHEIVPYQYATFHKNLDPTLLRLLFLV